jgi:hypothetical protein
MRDGADSSGERPRRSDAPKVVRVREWSTPPGRSGGQSGRQRSEIKVAQDGRELDDLSISKTQSSHCRKASGAKRGCVQIYWLLSTGRLPPHFQCACLDVKWLTVSAEIDLSPHSPSTGTLRRRTNSPTNRAPKQTSRRQRGIEACRSALAGKIRDRISTPRKPGGVRYRSAVWLNRSKPLIIYSIPSCP